MAANHFPITFNCCISMNRIIFIFAVVTLLSPFTANSQDLATRIPHDASAVVSVRGDHFFEMMDVADFNASKLGRKFLDAFGNDGNAPVSSIEDFGLDIHAPIYYYAHQTDSIWYNIVLLPLKDVRQFERGFSSREKIVAEGSGYRLAADSSSQGTVIRWNDRLAVMGFGSLVDGFFEDEAVIARYGITQPNYGDAYAYSEIDSIYDEQATDLTVETIPGAPYDEWDIDDWESDTTYEESETSRAADATDWDSLWDESLQDTTDTYDWDNDSSWDTYDYDDSSYWNTYEANRRKKDSLSAEWVSKYAAWVLSEVPEQNILSNASYVKSQDSGTLVSVWIANLGLMYDQFILAALGGSYPSTSPIGFGSLQAGVYADKEGMRLKTSLQMRGDMARSYSRIYNRKINRKFLRYLNSENLLGFFAYSINTQAYMEEFPKMLGNIYGPMVGPYADEIDIGVEILSLLLDEAAIAKTVKGDALFVLNGVTQHETAYTSYDYDEDYNLIEVEKTKTETIPDFLFMFSSDNPDLYQRLMDYTVRKGLGAVDNQVYTLNNRRLPVSFYVTYKKGIVFLGTARDQLEAIAANRFVHKTSRLHRKLVRKNQVSGYLSVQKALERIPQEELSALEEHLRFAQLFGHLGDFYFQSGKMKRNTFTGEFVAQAPKDFNNALQYLMWLVDYASDVH